MYSLIRFFLGTFIALSFCSSAFSQSEGYESQEDEIPVVGIRTVDAAIEVSSSGTSSIDVRFNALIGSNASNFGLLVACLEGNRFFYDPSDLEIFAPESANESSYDLIEVVNPEAFLPCQIVNSSYKNLTDLIALRDSQLQQFIEAEAERAQYISHQFSHASKAFDRQRFYSEVVFWVSHFILLCGFFAALIELKNAISLRQRSGELPKTDSIEDSAVLDITLGYDKLAMKSSVNGMALFVITIFFYLIFIKFVYPIVNV